MKLECLMKKLKVKIATVITFFSFEEDLENGVKLKINCLKVFIQKA